ncbi:hypothetical protein LUCX_124 [Xanthomonas phage vB_XciM_LucasX]|nr:hypothetical protein LUCX_124 [Xanthomonas phage vB_XciM_LucasX]
MELRESPLWQEIQTIAFDQTSLAPLYAYKVEFKTSEGTTVPFKVISLYIKREYSQSFGDEIILEAMFPAGDYHYDIYPYKQNLLATVTREGRQRSSDTALATPERIAQQYRAVLMEDNSATVIGARNNVQSKQAMNLSDVVTVQFQLIDLALERIRMHSVGGLFRNVTPASVVEYVLTTVSTGMQLDEANMIKGVDMVPSPNQDAYQHIVIPHGTRFPDFPGFMNRKVGGIYPAGMGVYLQSQQWYVYPLFDLTRFDNPGTSKTLTLFNLPTNQLPNVETTYRTTANQVLALVTGDVSHVDLSETKLLNEGNGTRYLDARTVVDTFAVTGTGDNKAAVTRAENNNEFVTDVRQTGLNNVVTSGARITSNKFLEMSKLAARTGANIQCTWQNSDPTLIQPGMPVKFMYIKDDQVRELHGVVLGAIHYVQTYGKGVTESRHIVESVLNLFVEREQSI